MGVGVVLEGGCAFGDIGGELPGACGGFFGSDLGVRLPGGQADRAAYVIAMGVGIVLEGGRAFGDIGGEAFPAGRPGLFQQTGRKIFEAREQSAEIAADLARKGTHVVGGCVQIAPEFPGCGLEDVGRRLLLPALVHGCLLVFVVLHRWLLERKVFLCSNNPDVTISIAGQLSMKDAEPCRGRGGAAAGRPALPGA